MRELVAPSARERPRPRALGLTENHFSRLRDEMKCDQGLQHGDRERVFQSSQLSVHCRSSSISAAEALYKLSSGCRLQ
jgi:hypothetical protein